MTLAVAAICPWGPYPQWYRSLGLRSLESVILATDSRWSERHSGGVRPLLDVGKKLYTIDNRVGIVFAGDVDSGHDSINRLRREYQRSRDRDPQAVLEMTVRAFQACYASRMKSRVVKEPLYLLLAIGTPGVGVGVFYLGYETNFRPERRTGVSVIGDDAAKAEFYKCLGEGVGTWWKTRKPLDRATDWAIAVTGSLDRAAQGAPSVGGKTQLGIMSEAGFTELTMARLDYVAPDDQPDTWNTLTQDEPLVERTPPATHKRPSMRRERR